MEADHSKTNPSFFWLLGVMAIMAAVVAAFWELLGYRYSPEWYVAAPIIRDTLEFVWSGLSLAIVIICAVWLPRQRAIWRRILWPSIPLAAVSAFILVKIELGVPFRCYDMLLFCTLFGWATVSWSKSAFGSGRPEPGRTIVSERFLAASMCLGVLALGAFYFWQQVHYWNNLALGYADCAEHASLFYNTVCNPHELFLSVNPVKPMFWDHFYPGVVLLTPLWLLWPSLKMIITLQIVCILGVSLPLYWIGRRLFPEKSAALLLVVAWLVYPSTSQFIYNASYGFHLGNICLPLYFIALVCWLSDRPGWAIAMAIWAVLIKEEAAIVIGMFGLYLAIFERRRAAGIALTVCAFGFFLLVTTWVIPHMKLGSYVQLRFFSDLGNTTWEIFLSPFTKPRVFWGRLLEPRTFYFAATLLAPLLFYPLRRPSILLVASLTFMFDCLNPTLKSICYHYQAALLPVVFWALATSLQHAETKTRHAVLLGIIASGTLLSLFFGNTFWSKDTLTINLWPGRLGVVQRFGEQIDPHGSLFATQRVAAHFINQHHLYTDRPVPGEIDDALLDLRDSWRGASDNLGWLQGLRDTQREIEANPHLHLVAADDGLLLYARTGAALDAQSLVERDELSNAAVPSPIDLGYGVRVVGIKLAPVAQSTGDGMDRIGVTVFFALAQPTNVDLAVRCIAHLGPNPTTGDNFVSAFQPLGQGIWPISQWQTNRYYTDTFIITVPPTAEGEPLTFSFQPISLSP